MLRSLPLDAVLARAQAAVRKRTDATDHAMPVTDSSRDGGADDASRGETAVISRPLRLDTSDAREPLRVLLVINRLWAHGGAEGSTALIVEQLEGRGFHFGVVVLHDDGEVAYRKRLESLGVDFYPAPEGRSRQLATVWTAMRRLRPHLVHGVLFDAELVARLAAWPSSVPVLASIVNDQYGNQAFAAAGSPQKLRIAQRVDGALARFATGRFHAISEAVARAAESSLRIDPTRISVVYRGRDEVLLGRRSEDRLVRVRSALDLPLDSRVIINVARQDPQKGQMHLMRAFAAVLQEIPEAILILAGRPGPSTESLVQFSRAHQMGSSVRFLGMRDDVPDLLAASDLFVFPSLYEGLGGAVLEAMALEVPIVAFDIPPVRESTAGCALLVPPQDEGALGDAMMRVLEDRELADRMAKEGRERFESTFSLARYVEGMASLYRATAQRPAGSGPVATPVDARSRAVYGTREVVDHYRRWTELLPCEEEALGPHLGPGAAVLDLGVGAGRTTGWIAPRVGRYVGIDYAHNMVEACRERFPGLEIREMDAADLSEFESESFDLVLFSFNGLDVLHPLDKRRRCVSEMARVVRPDGHVVLSSHNARALLRPAPNGSSAVRRRVLQGYASVRLLARALPSAAFWRGEGYLRDPSSPHVLYATTEERIASEFANAGLILTRRLPSTHPVTAASWMVPWAYFVFERSDCVEP